MSKIKSTDLDNSSGIANSLIKKLENCAENSRKMANQIALFSSSSQNQLQGIGYDAVRKKLRLYEDALKKQSQICDNLISGLTSANNTMLNYMEGYDMLNDEFVSETEISILKAKNKLNWLNEYTVVEIENEETKEKEKKMVRNGNDDEIAFYEEGIKELEKRLELLKGLNDAATGAWEKLEFIEDDVRAYEVAVGDISTSTFN